MVDRLVPTSASTPPISGPFLLDTYATRFKSLFDAIALVPTAVTNSGDDYTITVDPVLVADVVQGMLFYINPNVENTGAARLRVSNSNPYYDWVKSNGDAFSAGDLDPATTYGVVFVSGEFRTITQSPSAGAGGATLNYQEFTGSGTWTKPADLANDSLILVHLWGGGGGGNSTSQDGGGGGGAFNWKWFRGADLGATETVTIGAGGSTANPGNNGGDSSFGSHLTAFGGRGGQAVTGGQGAGQLAGGQFPRPSAGLGTGDLRNGNCGAAGSSSANQGFGGDGIFGGGGGAMMDGQQRPGGYSIYGGGGGGTNGAGGGTGPGLSVFGGDGGTTATDGSAPGGAGGCPGGSGARGECRVYVIGALNV